jgi:hypothetical protein
MKQQAKLKNVHLYAEISKQVMTKEIHDVRSNYAQAERYYARGYDRALAQKTR